MRKFCEYDFLYGPDQKYLERQMSEPDNNGNNPLHHAFQNKDIQMIELLLRSSFGSIKERNNIGFKPPETIQKLTDNMVNLLKIFDPELRFNG